MLDGDISDATALFEELTEVIFGGLGNNGMYAVVEVGDVDFVDLFDLVISVHELNQLTILCSLIVED